MTDRYPLADLKDLPDDIRQTILAVQEKAGFVPNVFLGLARRPAEWRAFFESLKDNADEVVLRIEAPRVTPERLEVYRAFHDHGHRTKGWPERSAEGRGEGASGLGVFLDNPFPTEEWSYWIEDRLAGVGYVDVLDEGLSAIYFFHDPRESRRSLGTLNILRLIEAARQRGLPHVYLGYYVTGCRSLEYKARFKPNEVFTGALWEPFIV